MLHVGRTALDNLAMAHHALRIDNYNGPAAVAPILAPKTIGLRHFTLGVEVSQQRIG